MPNYDATRHDPPAPVAGVVLQNTANGISVSNINMLIDTGADISLVPHAAIEQLGLKISNDVAYELVGFDGSRSSASAAELDLVFLRNIFRGKYVVVDNDWGVIGRDVLASLTLLFDGPRQRWLEHPAPQ